MIQEREAIASLFTLVKCKIIVLHRELYPEIAKEQGIEDLTPCPVLKEGQEYITTGIFCLIFPTASDCTIVSIC